MATRFSILARRIPWTEEPGGLQCMGLQRARHDWSNLARNLGLYNLLSTTRVNKTDLRLLFDNTNLKFFSNIKLCKFLIERIKRSHIHVLSQKLSNQAASLYILVQNHSPDCIASLCRKELLQVPNQFLLQRCKTLMRILGFFLFSSVYTSYFPSVVKTM